MAEPDDDTICIIQEGDDFYAVRLGCGTKRGPFKSVEQLVAFCGKPAPVAPEPALRLTPEPASRRPT